MQHGAVSARDLVETALTTIGAPEGEGARAFVSTAADRARAEADAVDGNRAAGVPVPPFAGIPVAIKDLADVEGEVTTAGSVVLADRPPAAADAPAVKRLRDAGFIVVGRTNMTEFAFSGLGLNPHYGTPRSPWDRSTGRIPGGSSSGTAVAVADGMVAVGLGTDTGGSCRIPAAFCNIVGYKPTAGRVPLDGIVPLAPSLDSVGPLGNSVHCVAITGAIMAGDPIPDALDTDRAAARPIKLGLITNVMLDDVDDVVSQRFEAALSTLARV
ncbi:MAG: amidase family protein, partial [Acidimicrobiia bacterium]|nr:amidase family protein [Acidimicrobiia bacterium]